MSKKVDENYFHDETEEEEDKKCPPQRHEGQRNVTPKHEATAIEEAVLFDEKKEIKGRTDGHVLASNVYQMSVSPKDRNTPHDTFRGGHMVSASRGPDYSLGAESVDIQGWHCPKAAENRRRRDQELSASLPGAFREGYQDIEEGYAEDEFTVTAEEEDEDHAPVVTRENSIKPVSADLVNEEEEGRRLQEKINQEINQALERERQQAVVAEVVPASDGDLKGTRRRHWFIVGALLLLVVIAIATPLGLKQGKSKEQDPCTVPIPDYIGDGSCDGGEYNTTECEWDGGDCIPCPDGFFGPSCNITGYPNCTVPDNKWIGDGTCDGDEYNTTECGWDGGDCVPCKDGFFGPSCNITGYPNCIVPDNKWIGDGACLDEPYNTTECGWDGGDCLPCDDGYYGYDCTLHYPNCAVSNREWIEVPDCGDFGNATCFHRSSNLVGDGFCDGLPFNTEECGWDGGDCCAPGLVGPGCDVTIYPNCLVPHPEFIGDGTCMGEPYNTTECGWDGSDCLPCDDGYYGYDCTLHYPDCLESNLEWIEVSECMDLGNQSCFYRSSDSVGDGNCNGRFNTEECGWDSGDCCAPGSVGPVCDVTIYPNCTVPVPNYIGDGACDGEPFNAEECGWDGGDCCAPGFVGPKCDVTIYPNCTVTIPNAIGNGECDYGDYNTSECGWDDGDCV